MGEPQCSGPGALQERQALSTQAEYAADSVTPQLGLCCQAWSAPTHRTAHALLA